MSRADEIAQGLREPGGALIGGLVVEDYLQGMSDFESQSPPPKMSSVSYDLGRSRAREKAEIETDAIAQLEAQQESSRQTVREMLRDKPDLLAEYDAKIAAIRNRPNP